MDGEPCQYCGSTETYDEDGSVFCANGHFQRPVPTEDGVDFGRGGKTFRKKAEKTKDKVSKVFRGRKAYRLFLQAWQFVLWKQCHALIHVKGLPAELWGIVRDLWALQVEKLRFRYETVTDVEGAEKTSAGRSGSSGAETETPLPEGDDQEQQSKMARKASDSPSLIDIAALNYLGILILRYPLGLSTFFNWIQTETIPLIRAIRHVPKEMRDHLPGEYHQALDTYTLLAPHALRLAVSRVAAMYSSTFGITIPPLNFHLFLDSYIETLALPLQTYRMVKSLNSMVNFSFAYPSQQSGRKTATSHPEAQLIALLVIATKLLFPFDSATVKRYPKSLNDPGAVRMNWEEWLAAKISYDEATGSANSDSAIKRGTEMALKDTDILAMDDSSLEEYMNWYQGMWVNHDRTEEGMQKRILDMFPLQPLAEPSMEEIATMERGREEKSKERKSERVRRVQASLKTRRVVPDEEETEMIESGRLERQLMRPGEGYRIFRDLTELGEGVEKAFHTEAAETAGVEVGMLLRAVRSVEDRIEKWRREKKREEMFGMDEVVEGEDGGMDIDLGIDEEVG